MDETMNQSLFEDESTIHFGGEDGEEFDYLAGFDDDTGSTVSAPTTEQDGANQQEGSEIAHSDEPADTAGQTEDVPPTTEDTGSAPEKLTFKAKIDHQEQDVSIGADELPTLYQKAQNMDRAVQRAQQAQQDAAHYKSSMEEIASMANALGFFGSTPEATIQAMMTEITNTARQQRIDELIGGGTAKEVAEFVVDQQMKPAQKPVRTEAAPEETGAADGEQATEETPARADGAGTMKGNAIPSPEQFNRDLQKLTQLRPDILESGEPFPDSVLTAYMQGENLTVAYLDYESKQTAAEKQALEKQNRIFRQNQESANRAPVKGVAGSGGIDSKQDPWLAGFDDPYW